MYSASRVLNVQSFPVRPITKIRSAVQVSWYERAFIICVLLLYSGAFLNIMTSAIAPETDPAAGTWQLQVVWAVVFAAAGLMVLRTRDWWRMICREWTVLAILALAGISMFWSAAPDITLRRTLALAGTVLVAFYLSRRYTIMGQLRLLGDALLIAAVASFVFGVAGIGTPVESFGDGSWFGVFLHKNTLGRMMALGVLTFVVLSTASSKETSNKGARLFSAAVCGIVMLASRSLTAVLVMVGLLGLFYVLNSRLGRSLKWVLSSFAAAGLVAFFVLSTLGYAGEGLKAAGKDATLSGRTDLWQASLSMAQERPWFGYGFNAFWLGEEGPSYDVWKQVKWPAPHSHNGFLDLGLDLGIVGVTLLLVGLGVQLHRAGKLRKLSHSPSTLWPFLLVAFFVACNITETGLVSAHSLLFLLYCTTAFSLQMRLAQVAKHRKVRVE